MLRRLPFFSRNKSQTATVTTWQKLRLPFKLLVLTTAFVMLAEVLIFVPSVANYRVNWLQDRLMAAHLAALAADAAPGGPSTTSAARTVPANQPATSGACAPER